MTHRVIFPVDCRFLEHCLCLWTNLVLIVLSGSSLTDGASLLLMWTTLFAVMVEELLVVPYGSGLRAHEPREALSNGLSAGSCVVPWVLWKTRVEGDGGYQRAILSSISILLFISVQYGHHANGGMLPKKAVGLSLLIYTVLALSLGHACVITSFLSVACFYGIMRYVPRTCTLGESIALSSATSQLAWKTWCMMYLRGNETSVFIQFTLSLGVLIFATGFIQKPILQSNGSKPWTYIAGWLGMSLCCGAYVLHAVVPLVHAHLHQGYHANMTRIYLVVYWLFVLATFLPLMNQWKTRTSLIPNSIHRKGFHLLALVLFVPSLVLDSGLLASALAIAFVVFVVLEVLRIGNIRFFSGLEDHIYRFMSSFIDKRDQGKVYMTHITLLLGLAVPIWLSTPYIDQINDTYSILLSFAGIIATGVGDAMASTVGILFGTIRIATKTSKTLQGTCASIVSMLLCWYVAETYILDHVELTRIDWIWLSSMTTASALFESITDQFDNVFVSVHYYVLLRCILTQTHWSISYLVCIYICNC